MIIELKDVSHNYKNFRMERIFLKIDEGQLIGIIGKNGSGKTTLLKIISGIIFNENVYIQGEKITKDNLSCVAYMDCDSYFYELLTVNEMIDFVQNIYNYMTDLRISLWMKDIGLSIYANELIKNLSLGNRQKLALILTLINKPKIILLDEPFNGIDGPSIDIIINILKELVKEKRTVIITTHIGSIINRLCTRLIELEEGSIIKDKIVI